MAASTALPDDARHTPIRAPQAVWLGTASRWALWLALLIFVVAVVLAITGVPIFLAFSFYPIGFLVLLAGVFSWQQWALDGQAAVAEQLARRIEAQLAAGQAIHAQSAVPPARPVVGGTDSSGT